MLSEYCMKFVDQAFRKLSSLPNAVDYELNGGLLIPKEIDKERRFDVCIGARYEFFGEAMYNERLRRPPIKVVEAF